MLAERVKDWTREWKRQGLEEGRETGLKEGEAQLLQRMLIRRFGALSPETAQRLFQATPGEIERWAENLLDARSLPDVFEER